MCTKKRSRVVIKSDNIYILTWMSLMSPIHQVRSYCKSGLLVFLLLTGSSTALTYEHFTIMSSSLGEGNFAYRLTMHDDPFSLYDDTFAFGVVATGVVSITVTPPGWTASVSNNTVLWSSNIDITSSHMPRPASYDFGFQSSFASHRTNDMDATVYGSLMPFTGGRRHLFLDQHGVLLVGSRRRSLC